MRAKIVLRRVKIYTNKWSYVFVQAFLRNITLVQT